MGEAQPIEPQVRAGLVQQSLATVRGLRAEVRDTALGGVSPRLLAAVEAAPQKDWLPLASDLALLDGLVAAVGADGMRSTWRASMLENFRRPPLGPVLHVAERRFGRSPEGFVRFAPEAFQAVFREAGRLEIAGASERAATLRYEGAPAIALASDGLLEALAATFEAGIAFGGAAGEAAIAHDEGRVVFELCWR